MIAILDFVLTFSCRSEEQSTASAWCVIQFNPTVAEHMSKDLIAEMLHLRHLPMLVKPKPWLCYNNSGYLYSLLWAMRLMSHASKRCISGKPPLLEGKRWWTQADKPWQPRDMHRGAERANVTGAGGI